MIRGRGRDWIRLSGAILLIGSVLACSSPERRYRVLSFFFDGVPPPEGMEIENGAGGGAPEETPSPFHPERTPVPKPEPPKIVSRHQPVAEGNCQACHDPRAGFQPTMQTARLCDQCHGEQRIREAWDHGPINLKTCLPCHRAHESPYPHLLAEPVPDICMMCHGEDMKRDESYHLVPNVNECMECHDPHQVMGVEPGEDRAE